MRMEFNPKKLFLLGVGAFAVGMLTFCIATLGAIYGQISVTAAEVIGTLSLIGVLPGAVLMLSNIQALAPRSSNTSGNLDPAFLDRLRALSDQAKAGNDVARRRLYVEKWNDSVPVGTAVLYLKSDLEGKVPTRTASLARLLGGDDYPVVELEGIGTALLDKIEFAPETYAKVSAAKYQLR